MSDKETTLSKQMTACISGAIIDGQNQIHDLRDGKATPEEIDKRMKDSFNFHSTKLEKELDRRIDFAFKQVFGDF